MPSATRSRSTRRAHHGSSECDRREHGNASPKTPRPRGGRPTLEQTLLRVWEGLHAEGAAECPVCHGRMVARLSGGDCRECGAHLS